MSRIEIALDEKFSVACGKDHVLGYFVQVYTNGQHPDECECAQCECDQPEFERDYCDGWNGVVEFVRESIGWNVMPEIVGVGQPYKEVS